MTQMFHPNSLVCKSDWTSY